MAPSAWMSSRQPRRCVQNSATSGMAARVNSAVIIMNGRSRSAMMVGCIGPSMLSPARTRWSASMVSAVAVPPFDQPNAPMHCGLRAPSRPWGSGLPSTSGLRPAASPSTQSSRKRRSAAKSLGYIGGKSAGVTTRPSGNSVNVS